MRSAVKKFSTEFKENISVAAISVKRKDVLAVELVWAQAYSAERLANPNSAFVTGTDNFHLGPIRSHESALVE